MSTLEYVPIPFFDDNYAWLITDGRAAIVVDPGDAGPVIRYCEENRLKLAGILVTHHHPDHIGGIDGLLGWSGNASLPVYGPAKVRIPGVSVRVRHGFYLTFKEPAFEATVIDVPGHTHDHIAFFEAGQRGGVPHLFCGDTLFASGCGRLLEGDAEQMLASLDALARLPLATQVHCAHEYTLANIEFSLRCDPSNNEVSDWYARACAMRAEGMPTLPTTLGHELAVNPFLRVQSPGIRAALINQFNVPVPNRLAAFILLRGWKDFFSFEQAVPDEWSWPPTLLKYC
ncbi:MAG TPA: hydroxyacylglutathione hydrolase [Paraburkholderia sp.]|nr:hydroxyacylglutathione hydrolase [Paraburkholderia sp.]